MNKDEIIVSTKGIDSHAGAQDFILAKMSAATNMLRNDSDVSFCKLEVSELGKYDKDSVSHYVFSLGINLEDAFILAGQAAGAITKGRIPVGGHFVMKLAIEKCGVTHFLVQEEDK